MHVRKFNVLVSLAVTATLSTELSAGILSFKSKGIPKPPACGLVGSIEQRMAHCASINDTTAPSSRSFKVKGKETVWQVVTRTKASKEVLYNKDLQMIWTDVSGKGVEDVEKLNHADSISACQDPTKATDIKAGLKLAFRLPSAAEAKSAIAARLSKAFESNGFKGTNNSGNNHGSVLPGWTSYSFFTDELVTTKDNKTYAIEYDDSSVSRSSSRVDYYTFKSISGTVYRGYEAKRFLRCVATVFDSDLNMDAVSEAEILTAHADHPNNAMFKSRSIYGIVEGSKPIALAAHHPHPDVDQPCVEFKVTALFQETQYKRFLVAQPLLDQGYTPMKINFGRGYIGDQFCTRDDSMVPIYQVDGVSAPSMPLYISADGNEIVGYDYKNLKVIPVWTKLGTANNGEEILLHHPTQLIVSELQDKVMDFETGTEAAKTFQLSFVDKSGARRTLPAGLASIPSGTDWSKLGRDGLPQLRPAKSWDRDSIWTANTSGTFLSRAWIQGNGERIAPDGDIYFSAFIGEPKGNFSPPYGFVDTLFTLIDSKAERKVIFVIPASALNQ